MLIVNILPEFNASMLQQFINQTMKLHFTPLQVLLSNKDTNPGVHIYSQRGILPNNKWELSEFWRYMMNLWFYWALKKSSGIETECWCSEYQHRCDWVVGWPKIILFVLLIIYLAPPTQIVPQLVPRTHKHVLNTIFKPLCVGVRVTAAKCCGGNIFSL